MYVSSITYPNKFASIRNFEQNKYIYAFDINTLELTRHILKLRTSYPFLTYQFPIIQTLLTLKDVART